MGVKNCRGWDCIQQVLEYGVGFERGNEYHTTSSVYPCRDGEVGGAARCTDAHSYLSGTFNLHILHAQLCKVCALRVDVYTFVRAAMRAAVQEGDSYMWGFSGAVHVEDSLSPEVRQVDKGVHGQKIKFVRPIVSNTSNTSDARTNFGLGKDLLCPLTLLGRLLVPGHITFELAVVRHGVAAQNGGAYLGYPFSTCDCNCCCCAGSH
jgi:hypothetical protein